MRLADAIGVGIVLYKKEEVNLKSVRSLMRTSHWANSLINAVNIIYDSILAFLTVTCFVCLGICHDNGMVIVVLTILLHKLINAFFSLY